jgi:S-phase kinase-associated protein 1
MDVAANAEEEDVKGLDCDYALSAAPINLLSKTRAYSVPRAAACISDLVVRALEHDPSAADIDLRALDDEALAKVAEYMRFHNGKEEAPPESPLVSSVMKESLKCEWDAQFIDTVGERKALAYSLLLAANYMNIPTLLRITAAKIASFIKGVPLTGMNAALQP